MRRKALRHDLASSFAGEGTFAPLLYWIAIAAFLVAEVALVAHELLLSVPPYRWLATAVVLAASDDPLGELRAWAAARPQDRGQVGGNLDLLGVVIMFVAVGVVVYAGFSIMSTTIDLTSLSAGDPLHNHQQNFTDDYGPMFGFIALILLVAFLAVIIVYLQAARASGFTGR